MVATAEISPLLQFKLKDSVPYALPIIVLGSLLYGVGLVLYRLYLHPLHKIPGPKIAAATHWYEVYQDIILEGNYVKEYPRLHAEYGPVVRVNPNRVHVSEPKCYDDIYNRKPTYLKDPQFVTSGNIRESLPMLLDPEIHRKRRKLVQPLFSPKYLELVAPLALQIVKNGLGKAVESHHTRTPLQIQRLYAGMSGDIMMQIYFDKQLQLIESTKEEPLFLGTLRSLTERFFLTKHFPILSSVAYLPDGLANILMPGYIQFRRECAAWIEDVKERHKNGSFCANDGRKTLFDILLHPSKAENPSDLPPLTTKVLIDEAYAFCFAGTHTTSISLSLGTYYLLRDPLRRQKLLDELKSVPRNVEGLMEYRDLYSLPYLTACIKEILRLSAPVPGILPRIVPGQGANCCGYYLPSDTIVSMSARVVHDNEEVFPEPENFIPERWMGPDAKDLDKYLVTFGKGPRACIGLGLAWMELYLIFANFFDHLDLSLWKTDDYTTQWRDSGGTMLREDVKVMVAGLK